MFLLTGYTVGMLTQGKTLVDAAKKAGVHHIAHVGVFAEWDTTDDIPYILGRPPKTFRDFLAENKDVLVAPPIKNDRLLNQQTR